MDDFKTSEPQLQALAHALAEGLLLFDQYGVVQYLNPEAERLLGWNRAEVLGIRTHRNLHDPFQTHDEEMCFFERAITTHTVVRVEGEKIFRADGSAFIASAVASPVSENGVVIGCAVALLDITEPKFTEQRERILYGITQRVLSEQPLPEIFQYLCDALVQILGWPVAFVAVKEDDGSARIVAQSGLAESEISSFQMRWDDTHEGQGVFGKAIRSGLPQIYNLKNNSNTQSWHSVYKNHFLRSVAGFPLVINNRVQGVLTLYSQSEGYFDDLIVARAQSFADQVALALWTHEDRRQLRLQTTALNASTHAVVMMDSVGKILWANPAFTVLTGYELETVLGQTPRFLRSGYQDQRFYEQMWETILAGHIWQGELINRRADGTLYSEEMTITPVKVENREITNFIAVKQDVSERLANQRALRNSEEQFRDMFETMSSAVAVFKLCEDGKDFICTSINRAA